jgi:hypothetical protein
MAIKIAQTENGARVTVQMVILTQRLDRRSDNPGHNEARFCELIGDDAEKAIILISKHSKQK